jgi:hypothetical protein
VYAKVCAAHCLKNGLRLCKKSKINRNENK